MSLATDTAAAERAGERIRRFGERQPEALRLARYASLAVSVDAALLRALRMEFLPGSDAGIEADVWLSPLTESVSSQGFVLDSDVVSQLRLELAAEFEENRQIALDRAARITASAHGHWPESLRLEERATAAALRTTPPAGVAITPEEDLESMLRGMVKAMTQEARGMEIARWAQRALGRLPAAARETEAALLLALGAAERLGTPIRFSSSDRSRSLPPGAAWVLSTRAFSQWTAMGVRRYDDGIEFVPADQAPTTMHLNLPRTTPLFVEVSWRLGGAPSTRTVSVAPGRTVSIPPNATEIRFLTLAGEELALDAVATGEQQAADNAPADTADDLTLACVRVQFDVASGDSPEQLQVRIRRTRVAGFFVTRETVLSVWHEPNHSHVGATCHVLWQGTSLSGTVIAEHQPDGEVLIRLESAVPDAAVLPRAVKASTVVVGAPWKTVVMAAQPTVIEGAVEGVDGRLSSPPGGTEDTGKLLRLTARGVPSGQSSSGSPVVIDGTIVGILIAEATSAETGTIGERVLFARPTGELEPFISDALRPGEHDAIVFVSYAPEDSYGKGIEIDGAQVDRVTNALREAGVNPHLDTDVTYSPDALVQAINGSEGGVFVWTPVSHRTPESAHLELIALAYRRWAQPDFPLAAFRFRRDEPPQDAPPSIAALEALDLDKASAGDLLQYVSRTFSSLNRVRDERSAIASVKDQLVSLLSNSIEVDEVLKAGVHADLPWSKVLTRMSVAEARQVADIAAMFSFPPETHEPLREAASSSRAQRAFFLRTTQVEVASALIRRAWIGRTPPTSVVFEDQRWPTQRPDPTAVAERVVAAISQGVACSPTDARWVFERVDAPILLTFPTPVLPEPSYVEHLLTLMPSALVLFLVENDEGFRTSWGPLVVLPRSPSDHDATFMNRLEQLKRIIMSRSVGRETEPPSPSKKAAPRRPTTATKKTGQRKK